MKTSILVVEDDKTTSLLIQKHIKSLGYNLSAAVSSGEEAIVKAGELQPDIVLMDITLEGKIDGIDTAKEIFDTYDIPFIYITSSTDDTTIERAKEANPFGYIIKPIDLKECKASIEMAILRYNMEKTLKENENKFSTILNSIGDAVIVIDTNDYIAYINPIGEFMLEYNYNEIVGKKFKDVTRIINTGVQLLKLEKPESSLPEGSRNYIVTKTGNKVPIEFNASPQKDDKGNPIGTVIVFRDITDRIKYEDKLQESFSQLRKAMSGVIQAMAQTVETRDPYTAGHQRRVADLARTIAEEMQLSHDKIEGIRMAGVIHDLGKISIPAEILSKPGRISEAEFNLIKSHPQIAYDILKPIDFPWPVADIVYQHHEREDGSGYPRGLTKNEIIIEAKIMAVSDVVEAMASHRPYRAALGIELALDEISKNKGKSYDTDIVETCITLFRKKGYSIDSIKKQEE